MIATKKQTTETAGEKDWENPMNPEAPHDARDKEQAQRMYEESLRRKENLTDTEEDKKD